MFSYINNVFRTMYILLDTNEHSKRALVNLLCSYFHSRIKRRSFAAESCSCSISDWIRIRSNECIIDDIWGVHCNPWCFCSNNKSFSRSNAISLWPGCLWRLVTRERIISTSLTPQFWASLISYWQTTIIEREKKIVM